MDKMTIAKPFIVSVALCVLLAGSMLAVQPKPIETDSVDEEVPQMHLFVDVFTENIQNPLILFDPEFGQRFGGRAGNILAVQIIGPPVAIAEYFISLKLDIASGMSTF